MKTYENNNTSKLNDIFLISAVCPVMKFAENLQVQLRHVRFSGELKDSGRLAVLRQKLPQEAWPLKVVLIFKVSF